MNRLTRALAYLVCWPERLRVAAPGGGQRMPVPRRSATSVARARRHASDPDRRAAAAADGGLPEGPPVSVQQLQTFISIGIGDAHACGVRVNG